MTEMLVSSSFPRLNDWRLRSAAHAIPLPKPKPRALREHFIVLAISSRDVAGAEWSNVRRFEHLAALLPLVLLVADVLHPIDDLAIFLLLNGDVC